MTKSTNHSRNVKPSLVECIKTYYFSKVISPKGTFSYLWSFLYSFHGLLCHIWYTLLKRLIATTWGYLMILCHLWQQLRLIRITILQIIYPSGPSTRSNVMLPWLRTIRKWVFLPHGIRNVLIHTIGP